MSVVNRKPIPVSKFRYFVKTTYKGFLWFLLICLICFIVSMVASFIYLIVPVIVYKIVFGIMALLGLFFFIGQVFE